MATARELLEQADALMRRNRGRETAAPAADFPVLTDRVAAGGAEAAAAVVATGQAMAPGGRAAARAPVPGRGPQPPPAIEVPMLTERVDEIEPISILGLAAAEGEPSQWPEFDLGPTTVIDRELAADDALPAAAPAAAERSFAAAPPVAQAGTGDADAARWSALAEEIRMQVLQRIDIFTDTGLQEQLAARLQPIVDRASADLVFTINQQVGQLLRTYVAEAIEREIDSWRRNH